MFKTNLMQKLHTFLRYSLGAFICVFALSLGGCSVVEYQPLWNQEPASQASDASPNRVSVYQHGDAITSINALKPGTEISFTRVADHSDSSASRAHAKVHHCYYSALGQQCCTVHVPQQHGGYSTAVLCITEEEHWELFHSFDNETRRTAAP